MCVLVFVWEIDVDCRGRKAGACYRQTRHSINILRAVIIIYALMTWFYLVLLAIFLLIAGPAYVEVTQR